MAKSDFTGGASRFHLSSQQENEASRQALGKVKVSAEIPAALHEDLLSYCHFEIETQSDVIEEALRAFFKNKKIKPLPDKLKNKPRPGRKRKS